MSQGILAAMSVFARTHEQDHGEKNPDRSRKRPHPDPVPEDEWTADGQGSRRAPGNYSARTDVPVLSGDRKLQTFSEALRDSIRQNRSAIEKLSTR
ncbi:MAG: hypothetical protein J0H86_15060 [Xanthomonadaceae bacterium]|nr:hypothetical protein [Xanthomonadaceae bacterium]